MDSVKFCLTNTGLDNTPPKELLNNLRASVVVFTELSKLFTIELTSGYRSPEVNKKVGGSPTSSHMQGLAMDIRPLVEEVSNYLTQYCENLYGECVRGQAAIEMKRLGYGLDQIILELTTDKNTSLHTIHIGIAPIGKSPRKMKLTQFRTGKGKNIKFEYVNQFTLTK